MGRARESSERNWFLLTGKRDTMLTRIKVNEAATQLSISEQTVRVRMQRGMLSIGMVINNGGTRNTYVIYQEWLDEWAKNRPKEATQR